jgi:hypothetical protein
MKASLGMRRIFDGTQAWAKLSRGCAANTETSPNTSPGRTYPTVNSSPVGETRKIRMRPFSNKYTCSGFRVGPNTASRAPYVRLVEARRTVSAADDGSNASQSTFGVCQWSDTSDTSPVV